MASRPYFPPRPKSFSLSGRLFRVGQPSQVTTYYQKTEVVLSVANTHHLQDVFPEQNPISFEFAQEKALLPAQFKQGDEVTIEFVVAGRSYERYGEPVYFTVLLAQAIYFTEEGPLTTISMNDAPPAAPYPYPTGGDPFVD